MPLLTPPPGSPTPPRFRSAACLLALLLPLGVGGDPTLHAQTKPDTQPTEPTGYDHDVPVGPHHRYHEFLVTQTSADGSLSYSTNRFVQLETGLNYWEPATSSWLATEERFELLAGGAVAAARKGPHKVMLTANAAELSAVDLEGPDGTRLASTVYGLSLFDSSTGSAVRRVDEAEGFTATEGQRQRVLADDPYAGELDLHAALPVVAIGQQQVFIGDVITDHAELSGQLRQEPDAFTLTEGKPGFTRNGLPLGEFFKRGLGFVVVPQSELVRQNEVEFLKGVHPLFYRTAQSFPKANEWGVIATVSWSASRAMDYLETDRDIDARRIAVMGHSKMGKTALWTAAQDQRFAMVISAQSGCAAAALWKRHFGENMEKMVTRLPYWLCRNAAKFARNEDDLPVDQHMLLACIAPRPLYVASGEEDLWADPRGEYLSAYHASQVYRLLGKKGLDSEKSPPVGQVMASGDVGYHNRAGGHTVEMFDWLRVIEFAERHLKSK